MRDQTSNLKTGKKTNIIIAVLSSICLILAMILVINVVNRDTKFKPPKFEETVEKGIPNVDEKLGFQPISAPTGFSVGLCSTMYQQQDESLLIYLTNPEINDVNIKCEIVNEENEILYESGVIKPGEYVKKLEAEKEMPKEATNIKVLIYGYEIDTWYSMGTIELDNVLQPK